MIALLFRSVRFWLTPVTTNREEAFSETLLRIFFLGGLLAFCVLTPLFLGRGAWQDETSFYLLLGITLLAMWVSIRHQDFRLARISTILGFTLLGVLRLFILGYWSAFGLLVLMFAVLVAGIFIPRWQYMLLYTVSLIITYVGVAAWQTNQGIESPLNPHSFFANPFSASLVFTTICFINMGVTNLISRELRRQYRQVDDLLANLEEQVAERTHALTENEAKLRQVVENLREVVYIHDGEKIIYLSPAYEQVFGLPVEYGYNQDVLDLNHISDEDRAAVLAEVAIGQKTGFYDIQYRLNRSDGRQRWIHSRRYPIPNSPRSVGIIEDMTANHFLIQQTVELAMEKERAHLLVDFIQNVAHEFRTPLTIIQTTTDTMMYVSDPVIKEQRRERIYTQIHHLIKLVDMLATLARLDTINSLDLQPTNINDWLQSLLMGGWLERAQLQNRMICVELADELPDLRIEPAQLVLALEQIMDNALRYSHAGSNITIRTAQNPTEVLISIENEGYGITEEMLPHIFERLYRGDTAHTTRGLGLGLPIAKRIVELHQGRIEVQSRPNETTRFTICLPKNQL